MALTERVEEPAAPAPSEQRFRWGAVPVALAAGGERRLEARTFLTDGYGLRRRLESIPDAVVPFADVARLWQPNRLKGFVVPPGRGLPFLSAGQVFESRPRVRKWLAKAMLNDAPAREVELGWLLMSISGEVGRVTTVYEEHLEKVITHDLLRIEPKEPTELGWLYAYMRTPTFFSIARSSQYGHMIKHLEAGHVSAMPVFMPEESVRKSIGSDAIRAVELRRRSRRIQKEANDLYQSQFSLTELDSSVVHGVVKASMLFSGRRRLDGEFYRADVLDLESVVRNAATHGVATLDEVSDSVSLGNRFKRFFSEGEGGTTYRSASELFDVNAPVTKRIYSALLEDPTAYMLESGYILMACSGQTYGLLGRTLVTTSAHEGVFGSHDLIRIKPNTAVIRTGYLQTVLNHQELGRPLVIRNAYGTSIPHLDPVDVRGTPIPRFSSDIENRIADLAEEAIENSRQADELESSATERAEQAVENALLESHHDR